MASLQNNILGFQDLNAYYGRNVGEDFKTVERVRKLVERQGISLAFQPFGAKQPVEPIDEEVIYRGI